MTYFTIIARRIFFQTFQSLFRNKWSNLTTILALTLVFLLVHVSSAFIFFADNLVQNLEKKVDIAVFFLQEAKEDDVKNLLNDLENQKKMGIIQDFNFFSQEEALKDFETKYPGRMIFLRRYNLENPLVSMVEIIPNQKRFNELMIFLNDPKYTSIVDQEFLRKNEADKKRVENFIAVAGFAKKTGGIIFTFFLITAIALVFYAISTATRKHAEEIFIMRLVGARFMFIRTPFIIEGIGIAFTAFLFSIFCAYSLLYMFFSSLRDLFSDPDLHRAFIERANEVLNVFFGSIMFSSFFVLVLAILGSFLAIEQYLRQEKLSLI